MSSRSYLASYSHNFWGNFKENAMFFGANVRNWINCNHRLSQLVFGIIEIAADKSKLRRNYQ